MINQNNYQFTARLWLHPGDGSWHFVSVPVDISEEIDFYFASYKRGFGSLRVEATVGNTTWSTSIFPDRKRGTYLLPVKKAVREVENLRADANYQFQIIIRVSV